MKKRLLFVQPSLQPPGGGNGLAAWMIQALLDLYAVTILCWQRVEVEPINRFYGTQLRPGDFQMLLVPRAWKKFFQALPVRGELLKRALTMRLARQVAGEYDLVVGANNEFDCGRRVIQYVHFPWGAWPRPVTELHWYHYPPAVLKLYFRLAEKLGGSRQEWIAQNLTLVNSDWVGNKFRAAYGSPAITVYPPVPVPALSRSWTEREDSFLYVGRFSPEKRLEIVIEILRRVRSRGKDVRLSLVGSVSNTDPRYSRLILEIARREASWVSVHLDIPRRELLEMMSRARYGLHGMKEEHFGMAVAELMAAGCIPFMVNGGGQVEIVGKNPHLVYDGVEDATEKILRVLDSPPLQEQLCQELSARRHLFTAERFMAEIRQVVEDFLRQEAPTGLQTHESRR